ncbi:MAG: guanylate kinase [Anaerolineae bacterium]
MKLEQVFETYLLFIFLIETMRKAVYHPEIHHHTEWTQGLNVDSVQSTPYYWGLLFVLVGPPGAGKNALMNAVLGRIDRLRQLPTATTRSPRATEVQGREHLFVSSEEFQRMLEHDELAEYQPVHNHMYGTPRATLERAFASENDLIADIDVFGAQKLRLAYPDNTVLIFIRPPSIDVLAQRMEVRGETAEEIDLRLKRVEMEMQFAPQCDYLITNDDFNIAAAMLEGIVWAEFCKRDMKKLRQTSSMLEA